MTLVISPVSKSFHIPVYSYVACSNSCSTSDGVTVSSCSTVTVNFDVISCVFLI